MGLQGYGSPTERANLMKLSTLAVRARLCCPGVRPLNSRKTDAKFFESVDDLFELQRGLNNCFAYDLVPSLEVVESALKASRRVNDYSTAVRIFEGLKEKVENSGQYKQYLEHTSAIRKELGVDTKEDLYAH
jgi:cytochrome c oxidase subunit 5a